MKFMFVVKAFLDVEGFRIMRIVLVGNQTCLNFAILFE